jgi:putative sigma-54 modulation protein
MLWGAVDLGEPMNISITFRHMDSSDAIKRYAGEKLSKLQRFLRPPMSGKVTVAIDRLKHVVEARISSGGEHLEAHDKSHDMYSAIDLVMDKLERQIRGSKGVAQAKRRRGKSLRTTPLAGSDDGARKRGDRGRKASTGRRTKTN